MNTLHTNPYVHKEENKLVNSITGEKLLCGDRIFEIIDFLKIPKPYRELEERFEDINEDLGGILKTLAAKSYIVLDNNYKDTVTQITPHTPHLFNLPYKSIAAPLDKKSFGFIGVPLGIGNKENIQSSQLANSLRAYTKKYGLDLSATSQIKPDVFGGTEEDYHQLMTAIKQGEIFDYGNIFFNTHESPGFMYEKIYEISRTCFSTCNLVPFFIGGDHSISYPLIKGAIDKYGDDLCVLHFDAHTDTYTSSYDNIKNTDTVHHHGNFMTKCFDDGLKHAFQFGIRGIVNNRQTSNENRTIIWAHEIKKALKNNLSLANLPAGKKFYVTFDFDVLDPAYFNNTSTPVINGLTFEECQQLIRNVLTDRDIVGCDIVEVYPDSNDQSPQIVCQMIFDLINSIKKNADQRSI
ncbi:arginase family protein [Chryseobacterium carnipullorum]|uniref:Agmatinase n=1 Tax=Chryseobacterium carnipullorum TaxID=1124835 RepID=A0A376EP47_CHRCU|nr:arginase family protein [Chryseobacterium carnipullorum]AZA47701.1 arginase family protein [Chryseobacterium carnipullorum]AZA67024.1 arginase family protein [Chryseobacterium carnipullorum]STD11375.1 Agmatinase [Chryseobacterium carnipullorum]